MTDDQYRPVKVKIGGSVYVVLDGCCSAFLAITPDSRGVMPELEGSGHTITMLMERPEASLERERMASDALRARVAELEGALDALLAWAIRNGQPVTPDVLVQVHAVLAAPDASAP